MVPARGAPGKGRRFASLALTVCAVACHHSPNALDLIALASSGESHTRCSPGARARSGRAARREGLAGTRAAITLEGATPETNCALAADDIHVAQRSQLWLRTFVSFGGCEVFRNINRIDAVRLPSKRGPSWGVAHHLFSGTEYRRHRGPLSPPTLGPLSRAGGGVPPTSTHRSPRRWSRLTERLHRGEACYAV